MSEETSTQDATAFSCSTIVHRAILRKGFINKLTGEPMIGVFMREPKDTDGLSVDVAFKRAAEDFKASFKSCFGVLSLHVGRVRDIELDVQPDYEEHEAHALIIGLPAFDENIVEAERLATKLRDQARRLNLS